MTVAMCYAPSHALALCAALVMTVLRCGYHEPFYDRLVVATEVAFSASFPGFFPTSLDPPVTGGGRKERGRVCLRHLMHI